MELLNTLDFQDQSKILENTKEYYSKIDNFISIHSLDCDYSEKFINSVQIIINQSGKVLEKFKFYDETQLKLETIYFRFIQLFLNSLDQKINKKIGISNYIKLLKSVKSHSRITLFMIKLFSRIFDQIINDSDLKIDSEIYCEQLIETFYIDLKINEFRNELNANKSLTNYFNELCNKWKNSIEYFFTYLSQDIFVKNINCIQKFYDCYIQIGKCPYKSIASRIISKTEKDNLYSDIISENNIEKLKHLLSIYKDLLTNNQNYDNSTIIEFGRQLISVYENSKDNYKFFCENYNILFEYLFDSFLKVSSKMSDSLYILSKFQFNFKQIVSKIKSKLKSLGKFNVWMVENLIECTNQFRKNWNYKNQKENNYVSLDLFVNFIQCFIDYIYEHVTDKKCSILCLNLIISLLNLSNHHQRNLILINQLLSKDNFYLLKDYPSETVQVLNMIIDSASNIENLDEVLLKQISSPIKSLIAHFKSRIIYFKETICLIQNNLFERLIFEPIDSNYLKNEYFEAVFDLMEFLSFENYPKEETSLTRLKNTYSIAISDEIFESIELEDDRPKTKYYLSFFNKISQSILTRNDIMEILEDQFLKLLDICEETNNFKNEFHSYKFTFHYHLVKELTLHLFKLDSCNEKLIHKCISIWFQIYDKDNLVISSSFYASMLEASKNYPSIVSKHAYELWDMYLDTKNIILLPTLAKIYDLKTETFLSSVSTKFSLLLFEKGNFEYPIRDNIIILNKIAEITPEYYFKSLPNREINLIELFELSKTSPQKSELQIFFTTIHLLIKAINDQNLPNNYLIILFENRLKILRFLFFEGENKPKDGKRNYLVLNNHPISISINFVTSFYSYLAFNLENRVNIKSLIDELVDLFDEIVSPEASILLYTLERIGKFRNKIYLDFIKLHHNFFLTKKKDQNFISISPELETSLTLLINLIEEKTLETFTNQLNENQTNIKRLDKNVKKQELNITNIKQNINEINDKIDDIEETIDKQDKKIETIDGKTLFNLPIWCKEISQYLIKLNENSWILVAKRLNFTENDIKGWLNQIDPCISMLQEWFVINKTSDAITGLLKIFKELDYTECMNIIEKNQKEIENNPSLNDEEIDNHLLNKPPHIFICYEWSSKSKAELLRDHLIKSFNDLNIWFDDGKYGGGELRNKRIDIGLRSCYLLICLITSDIVEDQTCLNQINLAVQLNKVIIPLLLDNKLKWPPRGSLGPIMSEYLFIRFFQRPPKELTNDERYWPEDKFNELVMQVRQSVPIQSSSNQNMSKIKPEVFISYQWDKQKDIINLYNLLTNMGLTVWLDIYQMGGGDSLYYKIDDGLRNCDVVISCVTTKYGLSANCRKEIALADSLPKPIIPILLEKNMIYPPVGPMAPTLSVLKYIDFTLNFDENNNICWKDDAFNELLERMKSHLSKVTVDKVTSKACLIS